MSNRLNNKVAIITGGTTGIGIATAKRFIEEGAKVVITGTNTQRLEAARSELGGKADVIASDASSEKDIKELFDHVVKEHGKVLSEQLCFWKAFPKRGDHQSRGRAAQVIRLGASFERHAAEAE